MDLKNSVHGASRRDFIQGAVAGAAMVAATGAKAFAVDSPDQATVIAEIAAQHDATVKMLQDWIALPSIAAENRNYPQGPEYMAQLARDAGFQHVEVVPTAGKAGVVAVLDSGALTLLGIYFMYDVKQFDPPQWSPPPPQTKLLHKPVNRHVILGPG